MYTDQVKYAMDQVQALGGVLFSDNGMARVRMADGSRIRFEMLPFLDIIHANNDHVLAALKKDIEPVAMMNTDILTAKAVKQAIKDGKVQLTGRVIYHKITNRLDITYLPKVPSFYLAPYRKALISRLKDRLAALETQHEQLVQKQTANDWDEAKWKKGQPERDLLMQEYNQIQELLTEGGDA
jgi:hypothetical protein